MKLFFGSLLPEEENIKKILDFKEKKVNSLASIEASKQNLSKVLSLDKTHYYYYLTALFGEHMYKAYIGWANEAVAILENLKDQDIEK